jgi:hypothetical protein
MTTKTPSISPKFVTPTRAFGLSAATHALLDSIEADGIKFRKMPLAKQRAELIRCGALTPEGKLPVYPMDHVPLGPRE